MQWLFPALIAAASACAGAQLYPDRIVLTGPAASQQLVAVGNDCVLRSSNPAVVAVDSVERTAVARKAGAAEIKARCRGGETAHVSVEVRNQAISQLEPRFSPDVISILTIKGCNGSGCHGSPAGQNGFKLSLFGYDVEADREMIVTKHDGRRVNLQNPEHSLFLRKPLFEAPHGGGRLMTRDSEEYKTLLRRMTLKRAIHLLGINLDFYLRPTSRHSAHVIVDRVAWREPFEWVLSGWRLIVLLLAACGVWLRGCLRFTGDERRRALLHGLGLALPALYVAAVTIVFESGENMRYRFFLEPTMAVFVVLSLSTKRRAKASASAS